MINLHRYVPIVSLAAIAIVALIAGCESSPPPRASVEAPPPIPQIVRQGDGARGMDIQPGQVPGMTGEPVRSIEMPGMLKTSGQVSFDDRRVSTIVSRVAGRIENTRVSQWDYVRRGEPIVELYSPDFMTAEAEYLQARTTSKLSAGPQADDVGGLAAAMVSAARRKLELLGMSDADIAAISSPNPAVWVRAPMSGTVVENKALRGAAVNPGDVLYSLGTLDDVWIVGDIYEDELARVHVGEELEAVTTAYPGETFKGYISRISPNIDPGTHALQIRCEIRNPGGRLKPQMLARVTIVTRPGEAVVIPQKALVFDTDHYYAFVEVAPNRFERRAVDIASWKEAGYARIVSGIRAGDRVVAAESIQINELWHEANGEGS